jgi:hypothetical protein
MAREKPRETPLETRPRVRWGTYLRSRVAEEPGWIFEIVENACVELLQRRGNVHEGSPDEFGPAEDGPGLRLGEANIEGGRPGRGDGECFRERADAAGGERGRKHEGDVHLVFGGPANAPGFLDVHGGETELQLPLRFVKQVAEGIGRADGHEDAFGVRFHQNREAKCARIWDAGRRAGGRFTFTG